MHSTVGLLAIAFVSEAHVRYLGAKHTAKVDFASKPDDDLVNTLVDKLFDWTLKLWPQLRPALRSTWMVSDKFVPTSRRTIPTPFSILKSDNFIATPPSDQSSYGSTPPLPLSNLGGSTGYYLSNGCHVYIQGAIHSNPYSAMEVDKLLQDPGIRNSLRCIVVELDNDRYMYLQFKRRKSKKPRKTKRTALRIFQDIMNDDEEKKKGQAILGYVLAKTMRAGEKLDFEEGADFLSAIKAAESLHVPLALADQPTNRTVDKIFTEFSPKKLSSHLLALPRDLQFLTRTLFRGENGCVSLRAALARLPSAAQLFFTIFLAVAVSSELPFGWNLAATRSSFLDVVATIEQIALIYIFTCFPSVLQVLFAERDVNMLRTIQNITHDIKTKAASGADASNENSVVVIVGLAHVNSMLNIANNGWLKNFAEERVAKVTPASRRQAQCEVELVYPDTYVHATNPFLRNA